MRTRQRVVPSVNNGLRLIVARVSASKTQVSTSALAVLSVRPRSHNLVEEVIIMLHRKLGNTGISVGKIALGTMYFGSETPEADAFAILDTFIEAGGNLVDTANVYVNGVSEEIIG
jgi:hypothetical protein